jgi:hypothetical protein
MRLRKSMPLPLSGLACPGKGLVLSSSRHHLPLGSGRGCSGAAANKRGCTKKSRDGHTLTNDSCCSNMIYLESTAVERPRWPLAWPPPRAEGSDTELVRHQRRKHEA